MLGPLPGCRCCRSLAPHLTVIKCCVCSSPKTRLPTFSLRKKKWFSDWLLVRYVQLTLKKWISCHTETREDCDGRLRQSHHERNACCHIFFISSLTPHESRSSGVSQRAVWCWGQDESAYLNVLWNSRVVEMLETGEFNSQSEARVASLSASSSQTSHVDGKRGGAPVLTANAVRPTCAFRVHFQPAAR